MDFSFVINFTCLLSCCFGGIVKRDISDQNEVPHHHHHLHSYGYYSSLQDQDQSYHGPYRGNPLDGGVCGSLRRIFILMVDSGVSQCKPLPKTIKGPIRNFCLHAGSEIIGDCLKLNQEDGLECMNNATKAFGSSDPFGSCFCSAMYETFFSSFSSAYFLCTKYNYYTLEDEDRVGRRLAYPDSTTFVLGLEIGKGPSDSNSERDSSQFFIDFDYNVENLGIPKNKINNVLGALGTSIGVLLTGKKSDEEATTIDDLFVETKTNLIDKAKGFLETFVGDETTKNIDLFIDEAQKLNEVLQSKMSEIAEEKNLETLNAESVAVVIKNIISELTEAKFLDVKPKSSVEVDEASNALDEAVISLKSGVDQVFLSANAAFHLKTCTGDMCGVGKDPIITTVTALVPLLAAFKTAVENYAAAVGNSAVSKLILDAGIKSVTDTLLMITNAVKASSVPTNPLLAMKLLKSFNQVDNDLKATLLSNPGTLVKNSVLLAKSMGNELEEFKVSLEALQIKELPEPWTQKVLQHFQESESALKNKIGEVMSSALAFDKAATLAAIKEAVLMTDDFINAVKEAATIIEDKDVQAKVIEDAQKLLTKIAQMFSEAENVLKDAANQANLKALEEKAFSTENILNELQKTFTGIKLDLVIKNEDLANLKPDLPIMNEITNTFTGTKLDLAVKNEDLADIKPDLTITSKEVTEELQDILTKIISATGKLNVMTPEVEEQLGEIKADIESIIGVKADEGSNANVKALELSLVQNVFELLDMISVLPQSKKSQALEGISASLSNVMRSLGVTKENIQTKVGAAFAHFANKVNPEDGTMKTWKTNLKAESVLADKFRKVIAAFGGSIETQSKLEPSTILGSKSDTKMT